MPPRKPKPKGRTRPKRQIVPLKGQVTPYTAQELIPGSSKGAQEARRALDQGFQVVRPGEEVLLGRVKTLRGRYVFRSKALVRTRTASGKIRSRKVHQALTNAQVKTFQAQARRAALKGNVGRINLRSKKTRFRRGTGTYTRTAKTISTFSGIPQRKVLDAITAWIDTYQQSVDEFVEPPDFPFASP